MAWVREFVQRKPLWLTLAVIATLATAAAAPWLLGKKCPRKIVIASGRKDGAYYQFAQQYKTLLAKDGIEVEVRETAGSVENTQLLRSGEASIAMVQGGLAKPREKGGLQSLASLYLEPVWVFCRSDKPVNYLEALRNRRIAIGGEGSGVRAVAIMLLADAELTSADGTALNDTVLTADSGADAASLLEQGEIDAAFFVVAPQSEIVQRLMKAPGIRLMNFRQAPAFRRKHRFLASVTAPEGLSNFRGNNPPRDIKLLAPAATLVARDDLHHALIPLILGAARDVHYAGGMLEEPGAFPSADHVDYPLNYDARRFLKTGPSFFYRYLPFWFAAWLDRVKLLLLPMFTLLFPLLKFAPPMYRWRIRSKIYRWYTVLRAVDMKLRDGEHADSYAEDIENLEQLERELAEIDVPLSYMQEFYNLRLHAAFVLDNLRQRVRDNSGVRRAPLRMSA